MELRPAEADALKRVIEEWRIHDERELEASFSGKTVGETTTFLAVAQRLEAKGFRAMPQEDYMNIITPDQVRFTLTGMGAIEAYCREESLEGIPFTAMIKDRAGVESNVDLKEYDVRVKIRREITLSETDPVVLQILGRWPQQRKAFRIMRRWTFMDEANGVRFDLSMVRSSFKDAKGSFIWQTTFRERDITRRQASYEMEVELLRPSAPEGAKKPTDEEAAAQSAKALKNLIRGIGEVLRGIHKHSILIRKSAAAKVLEGYKELTRTDRFRGVAPITMLLENMVKTKKKGVPNVRDGYNVTDKADGLRTMGYVDGAGELFLVDMSLNIYRTGLVRSAVADSLVDGEFVTQDRNGVPIQQYMIFDCYIAPGKKDVSSLGFAGEGPEKRDGGRFGAMMSWIERWNAGEGPSLIATAGVTEKNKILVSVKRFIFANAGDNSIFTACARTLDSAKMYHTDGLILTPNTMPLPQRPGVKFAEQLKWKPSDENTVDFLVAFDKDTDTKTDMVYTGIGSVQGGGQGATVQYKTMHLYVGSELDPAYEDPRGTVLFEQPLPGAGAAPQPGQRRRREYKPVLFNPVELPDTMANTCYMALEESVTGEDIVRCENGDPVEDKSIVEMRYEPKNAGGWRWIPMRVRYDKTERFQRGELGRTLNKDEAAEGVWNSIHEPVTVYMIRTGSEQPSAAELAAIGGAVAELASGGISKVYYDRKSEKKDLMIVKGLREFHRRYVKEKILWGRGLRGGGKTVVDLACGQGGDLWSWVDLNASFVFGTDIAGNGIRDPQDGAYRRYLNAVMKYGGYDNVGKMVFTIGSSAKNLATGEAGANSEESNMMRAILGRVAPEGPVPPFVKNYATGKLQGGADCVAIMFAIHYFFENEMSLAGFMRNVSDCLKIGGLFIGCCFDGQRVFDALRGQEENGTLMGADDTGSEVWRITKRYSATDLTNTSESLGLPVDVKFLSIGTEQREYLVPFEILKTEMGKIGCELLTAAECKDLGLAASTELFETTYAGATKVGDKFPMIPAVQQYSFFNRWFIFKRRRGGALSEQEEEVAPALAGEAPQAAQAEAPQVPQAPEVQAPEVQANVKKYTPAQLLQFYSGAADLTPAKLAQLGLGPEFADAARVLNNSAISPIKDDDVEYPSVDHYMAAMRYKYASERPELVTEFATAGRIHQKYLGALAKAGANTKKLATAEAAELAAPIAGTTFNEGLWLTVKDAELRKALAYRLAHDAKFRTIVEAARRKKLYLLHYSTAGASSELGGKRTAAGTIEGQNKVGSMIMELARF
jgi:hypothetical protein